MKIGFDDFLIEYGVEGLQKCKSLNLRVPPFKQYARWWRERRDADGCPPVWRRQAERR